MPTRRDLTSEEWGAMRARWEGAHDPADAAFKWLALEAREAFNAEVAPKQVERRAQEEGWCKTPGKSSKPLSPGRRGRVVGDSAGDEAQREAGADLADEQCAPPVYPVALPAGTKPPGYKGTGRPSDYREEYVAMLDAFFDVAPQTLIERTEAGTKIVRIAPRFPTFERFASQLGVTAQILQDWGRAHPEFEQARLRAKGIQIALLQECGLGGHYNANVANFALKNLAGWKEAVEPERDVQPVDLKSLDETYGKAMSQSVERAKQLRAERAAMLAKLSNELWSAVPREAAAASATAGEG